MPNEKTKLQLNRDFFIAIAFVLFICLLPAGTLVKKLLPATEESSLSDGSDVLDGNGTNLGLDDGQQAADALKAPMDAASSLKKGWFASSQDALNAFTDDLLLRHPMISFNTDFSSFITGDTYLESTQVLKGKEGWLFYKTQIDGYPIYDYMGINHFSDAELLTIASNLIAVRDGLRERGIDLILFGVSNKENIYGEFMPDTLPKVHEDSRLDQLTDYIHANTDLTFVNPKDYLLAEKENSLLYYKTDTHWNQQGAFVGTQAILAEVFGVTPAPVSSVTFKKADELYSGDLATIAGVEDQYKTDEVYLFDPSSADSSQKQNLRVLMVGDSFSGFLSYMCIPYFTEVKRVDRTEFSMTYVNDFQPDLIIWESVERFIEYFGEKNLLEY